MDVSIVILNYRNAGLVRQCIKTIKMYPTEAEYEMIVVDNDSGDGIEEMLAERYPETVFIASPSNIGYAAGNNLGISRSRGRYVLVMNPDITVRPGSIDALVRFMDSNPDVGTAGPKLVCPNGSIDESCYRFPGYGTPIYRRTPLGRAAAGKKALARYTMEDYDRKESRDVDWLLGAVLIVRRDALDSVGPLDERFFLYFEDTDWCRRFWEAGYRVAYCTDSEMIHYHERLSARGAWILGPLRGATRIHMASCLKYFWKWRKAGGTHEKERV